ncbi:MAG: tetratricopeptide repeat protein [Burkholderiaceae bacterium]|nr:tetratricopeptide repeat protein [Burkholderiaceae bacterium]
MRMEREGRLDEALHCYDAAIALAPDLARAHFNRGNILLDRGDAFEALPSYRKAIELKPDSATAHYNLGNAYLQLGNLQDSVTALRTAITLKPDFLDAHITLGLIHGKLGHEREAQLSFSNATRINADSAEIYCRVASCWLEAGFEQFAIHNVQRALSLQPDMVDALRLWGLACQRLKHTEDAIEYFRRGLSMQPDNAELLNHLGTAFRDSGRHDTAIDCYRRALAINPDLPVAHYNLGESLQSLGQSEDAISCYQRCLALGQSHYDVYISLAAALRDLGRDNEALTRFEQAIALQPDNPAGYIHRGVTLAMLGRLQEAQEDYQRALLLQPDNADAQLSMGVVLKDLGDVSNALTYVQRALEIQSDYVLAHNNLLFIQNYLAEQSGEQLLADARRFGEVAARLAKPYTDWPNPPDPARPLRVGLVSGDLGHHPVGFFLEGVLSELTTRAGDRLAFFAYSHRLEEDATSQRLRACCQGWLKTLGLSDEALARRIRDDRIDILIDLAGHTSGNRLAMFAWKPAPVQVSWLGYFATTGVAAMDYFLADPWTLPPEQEPFFTEQVWRLPETRLCFTPPDSQAQVNVLPALARGYVTFGCFNNLSKMNDAVVRLWAQVLQAVPNSRLLLKYRQLADASVRQRTAERFALHGISAQRLVFEGHSSRSDYLAAYHQVDIALDPFPFPGGTTTVEALWMGVPVLTLQGDRFLARQGVGLLMNAGLPEWVAADAQGYVRRASAHASDLPALAALRSRLRQQVLASPIYDAPRFAQHFETALRSIWQLWCA